jgi:hypothetical protein
MVLPLVWVVVGLGGIVASQLVQTNAKEKEKQARDADDAATSIGKEAIDLFDSEVACYRDFCNQRLIKIKATYAKTTKRAEPIFKHFALGHEEMRLCPAPPDFNRIEQLAIPDRPASIHEGDTEYLRLLSGETGDRRYDSSLKFGYVGIMQAYQGHSFGGNAYAAGAAAGAAAFGASLQRKTAAEKALTTATARLAEAKKLAAEIEGHTVIFGALKQRAEALAQKVASMKPFFNRYLGPAHAIYESRKARSRLTKKEWLAIRYLGRIYICLIRVCEEPLV